MPRRPEIGNVQLYPNRPLRKSDKNGYVLKFFCPLLQKRIRKNCGTRDRKEARGILRECRERLLNGKYVASGGVIAAAFESVTRVSTVPAVPPGKPWQECYDQYRENRKCRMRGKSLTDALSRLQIGEKSLEAYRRDQNLPEGLTVMESLTLSMLEYLQHRLLAGDESPTGCSFAKYGEQYDGSDHGLCAILSSP